MINTLQTASTELSVIDFVTKHFYLLVLFSYVRYADGSLNSELSEISNQEKEVMETITFGRFQNIQLQSGMGE